jgi:pimeloyl-ACP methyl ester carboxylesterase
MSIEPFLIHIPDAVLDDLRDRLHRTRWPDQIAGSGWDYGTDTTALRDLCAYWADGFDWRAAEGRLNAYPQAQVAAGGTVLHILRRPPTGRADAIPLLALHGWPGSFVQMLPLLASLPQAEARHGVAFDVVAASLPGYGFSDIPDAPGMNMARAGAAIVAMMRALGHERFAIRASDVGAAIARQICLSEPDRVIGLHISGTNPFLPPRLPDDLDADELAFVDAARAWGQAEGGYAHLHTTKPQTLAAALTDSPAGMAAWITEKFRAWGDTGGDVHSRFLRDDLLTNLTIYWATGTINASMRLYFENIRDPGCVGRVTVPTAMLMGPKDMIPTPRRWVERAYALRVWDVAGAGGHFMEWEEPDAVADHLCAFFAGLKG